MQPAGCDAAAASTAPPAQWRPPCAPKVCAAVGAAAARPSTARGEHRVRRLSVRAQSCGGGERISSVTAPCSQYMLRARALAAPSPTAATPSSTAASASTRLLPDAPVARTCASLGADCALYPTAGGGMLSCSCLHSAACGVGAGTNRCGRRPTTCAALGGELAHRLDVWTARDLRAAFVRAFLTCGDSDRTDAAPSRFVCLDLAY